MSCGTNAAALPASRIRVSPARVVNHSQFPHGQEAGATELTPYRSSTHAIGGVAELLFCTRECVACDLLSSKTGRQELAFCDVVDSLLQIGERGENLVKAHWIGEIHVPHCLVVASQRWQPLRSRDKPERAGLGLVVVRP